MLNFAVEKWHKYKKDLENYFQSHKQSDYAEEYYDFLKITLLTIFPEVDNCDNNITKHTRDHFVKENMRNSLNSSFIQS